MYLRFSELIPLYATEWVCFAVIGGLLTGLVAVLGLAIDTLMGGRERISPSRIFFAVLGGASLVIGFQVWIESFGYAFLELKTWHCLVLAAMVATGFWATFPASFPMLRRLRSVALPLSLVGSLTLLSGAWLKMSVSPSDTAASHADVTKVVRPNIVLITIDALAARHLTVYGSTRQTSPNIAAFASHSIVFDRFYAVSNFTTTGVASMLTGMLPWKHRALQLLGKPDNRSIAGSLPARLREAGYTTAYFASNPWAGGNREGFAPYFETRYSEIEWETAPCFDGFSDRLPYLCAAAANPFISLISKAATETAAAAKMIDLYAYAEPARLNVAASSWLSQRHAFPSFVWIHYLPPHDPYAAPPPWLGTFDASKNARTSGSSHPSYLFRFGSESPADAAVLEARYDESVSYVDYYVGRLIADVRATLGANTAIIISADHGESFSHGYGGHGGVMLYQDLIKVPLIVSLPNDDLGGTRSGVLCDQSDLAPTIAEIAGIAPAASWEGESLFAADRVTKDHAVFAVNFEQNRSTARLRTGSVAALRGDWKLMRYFGSPRYPDMPKLSTQLYNVKMDPQEQHDMADLRPDLVTQLSRDIERKLEEYGQPVGQ